MLFILEFFNDEYVCFVQSWIWDRAVMLKDENILKNFSVLDLCHGVRVG